MPRQTKSYRYGEDFAPLMGLHWPVSQDSLVSRLRRDIFAPKRRRLTGCSPRLSSSKRMRRRRAGKESSAKGTRRKFGHTRKPQDFTARIGRLVERKPIL
jgi:hypothetical protein